MKANIEVQGLKEILRALNRLPKEAKSEMRRQAKVIATEEAGRIRDAGTSGIGSDKLSAAVAPFVTARSDRLPAIIAGGTKTVPIGPEKRRKPAKVYQVFFGAEYGGGRKKTSRQFRPWKGKNGYWFWWQIRRDSERILSRWFEVVKRIEQEWGEK